MNKGLQADPSRQKPRVQREEGQGGRKCLSSWDVENTLKPRKDCSFKEKREDCRSWKTLAGGGGQTLTLRAKWEERKELTGSKGGGFRYKHSETYGKSQEKKLEMSWLCCRCSVATATIARHLKEITILFTDRIHFIFASSLFRNLELFQ